MNILQPHHPWCFQVELTEGCNRICSFCGINAIRDKPGNYKYMTEDLAAKVAQDIVDLNPNARIEFAMHGEPLQNPSHVRIFGIFRALLPKAQLMLTTNGKVLMKKMQERLDRIFDAGIDFVLMDTYYPERDALRAEAATLQNITVRDFYDDLVKEGWSPYGNHRGKYRRFVCLMDDIGARDGEHSSRKLHNHSGSVPGMAVPSEPLKKTCTKPFREMSVTWNGEVRLCCEDWVGDYVAGTAAKTSLRDIWYGEAMEAARAHLQNKDRSFGACKVCDASSGMRVGLLQKYPPLTDEQRAKVRDVEAQSAGRGRLVQLGRKV
jgi:MoaA/NifB/PqqE/SkfB family radical SAM enzyme